MRDSNKAYTTTIIIILLIVVGGIFGYIYVRDQELEIKPVIENKKIEEEKELEIDSNIVKKVEEDTSKIGAYNKYNNFDVKTMTKYNLIETAINGLDKSQINYCISSRNQIATNITIDDFNKSLNKYVKDITLTKQDLIENSGETSLTVKDYGYGSYAIVIDEDDISVIGPCGSEGALKETIETKTIKASTKEDNLYIYRKVSYGRLNTEKDGLTYTYYKDEERKEDVETVSISVKPTWDKYNTYISTYEKKDDTYYLISSKKAD